MSREEVLKKVLAALKEASIEKTDGDGKPLPIDEATNFVGDCKVDSLDGLELVMELEDAFEISIPDEEADKFITVGAVVDYLLQSPPVEDESDSVAA